MNKVLRPCKPYPWRNFLGFEWLPDE